MKLRHRHALSIFLVGCICVAAMLTDRALSTQELLSERAEARADALASAVAREIIDPVQKGDDKIVNDRLRLFSEVKGVERIQVSDMAGHVTHGIERRIGHRDEEALYRTGRELFAGPRGEARTVAVSIAADGFKRAIFPLLVSGFLWGGASLVILGVASWWLGTLAGRKIEALIDAVAHVDDSGTLELPNVTDNSEIGSLSRAFRKLHQRLQEERASRKRLEELRDDMTNMLVHDLKHPLTVFRMAMSILNDAESSSHAREIATALSLATRSSARMEAMIDGLLQAARAEHVDKSTGWARTPIVKFMQECAAEDSLIVKSSNRPWRLNIEQELGDSRMFAHPAMMRRLVGNLVLNAVDHSPEGTPVTLGARKSGKSASCVEIFVSNDATELQLKPEALKRGMYQSSGGDSHVGLGLAFCRMAAKQHSTQLNSRLDDNGQVVFSVTLPMVRDEDGNALRIKEVSNHESV